MLFWARTSIFAPGAIMLIGAAFIPVSLQIASGLMFIAILVGLAGLFRFWRELDHADEIPATVRRRLRQSVLLFGPLAVARLLIYNRFPSGGFSGLRDPEN